MRLVTVDSCPSGITLGKTIYNENGTVLLAAGTVLTDRLINGLKKYQIHTIYVEDEASEGIEIINTIPAELRNKAVNEITEGLNTIASIKQSPIRGLMKSERTIRTFQKIVKEIQGCLTENPTALNLLAATKVHENYVYSHCLNVAIYATQLGIENGLPIKKIEEIGLGAMLHDIGKLFVSRDILNKPGKLSNEEFEHVKTHSALGYELLKKIHEIPIPVAHCAYQHHERIDGKGYPRGLKGNEIHNYVKILSVVDVFDAVTSARVYRKPFLPHKGLELLYAGCGTQFENEQVQLFKKCIAIYPAGTTVQLNDGRVGIVSKYDFNAVGRPIVRIIKDEEQQNVKPYEIDLSTKQNLMFEIKEANAILQL
ncbi:HD-GYP domain-containing protein (c-di-GMP phosphodiesterase class II) [Salirhabdus euzebyi]|uniref:HD-GYP domain-containing protein (C-di-GMP phosphodiesterase class II) n=1 Tax=Salirhabdus euzebyi TaxID=394506 RepID=A0A841Q2K9_9BACI|nr:HD-GYP domain-containing protein [Salirhabdus euzebyi]MBB6452745.1 HD-GYP domain-containing protein (c-di-GMP phosphodiesterase class II) [Salirhabdus euzebyi]